MDGNLLLAIFVLLTATVGLVPLAKFSGLGTILGYLAAGILVGPYGLELVSDTGTIRHISEFGIVLMLFLIGLEIQPLELWRMRTRVVGMGLTQIVLTALAVGGLAYGFGMSREAAIVVGLALAMSSTAIALQTIEQRGIMHTATGRGALAILLVQDVAVIPILAAIPLLAGVPSAALEGAAHPPDWRTAIEILAAFAIAILAGRYLMRPVMRFVAATGVREAFTALALAIVVGLSLLMQTIGLSPALGAFMGGLLLADSEYRHELQSDLEPFKGLLLGLFFISVGMSIAFSIVLENPFLVIAIVVGLVLIKVLVLFALATLFRMPIGERLLLAGLLSQAGEFGFVILQFAATQRGLAAPDLEIFTLAIALSMAITPFLLFGFDRLVAPHLYRAGAARDADEIDTHQKVIVLGYGRFGQIVTRMLKAQGYQMTLIDDDPAQIDLVRRFGVKVFYGDGSRLDLLRAAGAADAELLVIAIRDRTRITQIAELVRRHFPHLKIAARAIDRTHAHDLMDVGVDAFERETFQSAVALAAKSLVTLGYRPEQAERLARAFEHHDGRILRESYKLRGDEAAYLGFVRSSLEMLDTVLQADALSDAETDPGQETDHAEDTMDVDKSAQAKSQ